MAIYKAPDGFQDGWSDPANIGGGGVSNSEKRDWDEVEEITHAPTSADFQNGTIIVKKDKDLYVIDDNGDVKKFNPNRLEDVKIKKGTRKPTKNDFNEDTKIVQWKDKLYYYEEYTDKVLEIDIKNLDEVKKLDRVPVDSDFVNGITLIQHDNILYIKDDNDKVLGFDITKLDEVLKLNRTPTANDFKDGITLIQHDRDLYIKDDNGEVLKVNKEIVTGRVNIHAGGNLYANKQNLILDNGTFSLPSTAKDRDFIVITNNCSDTDNKVGVFVSGV